MQILLVVYLIMACLGTIYAVFCLLRELEKKYADKLMPFMVSNKATDYDNADYKSNNQDVNVQSIKNSPNENDKEGHCDNPTRHSPFFTILKQSLPHLLAIVYYVKQPKARRTKNDAAKHHRTTDDYV
jgi:hypothetical protein